MTSVIASKEDEELVLIEASNGPRISVSKRILKQSCTLFSDLFEVAQDPATQDPSTIKIDFNDGHLRTLVDIITKAFYRRLATNPTPKLERPIERVFDELWPQRSKFSLMYFGPLYRLADYLGCEQVKDGIKERVRSHVADESEHYLRWASEIGSLTTARGAIETGALAHLDKDDDWWSAIAHLRPSWQVELSRIYWEQGRQLVTRPSDCTNLRANGKRKPRSQETMMRQRRLSWAQIAERFEPAQSEPKVAERWSVSVREVSRLSVCPVSLYRPISHVFFACCFVVCVQPHKNRAISWIQLARDTYSTQTPPNSIRPDRSSMMMTRPASPTPAWRHNTCSSPGATGKDHIIEPVQRSYWSKDRIQWQGGAVVLDTSDNVSVVAKSAVLQRFCGMFRSKVALPRTRPTDLPIPVPATTSTVTSFLQLLNDVLESFEEEGIEQASDGLQRSIRQINLVDTIKLHRLAQWADCKVVSSAILLRWSQAWQRMDLLKAASIENDVEVAKIAISRTPLFGPSEAEVESVVEPAGIDRWTKIADIRAEWQVELTRLYWTPVEQTIDRTCVESTPRAKGTGSRMRRKKEIILRRSHRTRKEMADLFNPK